MGIVIKMVIAQLLGTDDERQYRAAMLGLALGWQAEPLSSAVKQLIGKTTMAPVWDELHTVLGPVMDALTAAVATGVATVRGEEEDDELRQDYYCSAPGRPSSSPYNSWLLPVLVTTLKEKNIFPDHLQTALSYLLTSPGLILLPSAKPSVLSSWRQMALTLKENVVDTLLEASKSADGMQSHHPASNHDALSSLEGRHLFQAASQLKLDEHPGHAGPHEFGHFDPLPSTQAQCWQQTYFPQTLRQAGSVPAGPGVCTLHTAYRNQVRRPQP
jgi:hypothetical protein